MPVILLTSAVAHLLYFTSMAIVYALTGVTAMVAMLAAMTTNLPLYAVDGVRAMVACCHKTDNREPLHEADLSTETPAPGPDSNTQMGKVFRKAPADKLRPAPQEQGGYTVMIRETPCNQPAAPAPVFQPGLAGECICN